MARMEALIMGAGGRDFHMFNTLFRGNNKYQILAFTAANQIPGLPERIYPRNLAGKDLYPSGILIFSDKDLEFLIKRLSVKEVYFAYSDINIAELNKKRRKVEEAGAKFIIPDLDGNGLLKKMMLKSKKPVISICAVRTGCGKSKLTALIHKILKQKNLKPAVIRHPMAYSQRLDLQACQKFTCMEDFYRFGSTLEEREDIEHYVRSGNSCYCGVDYQKILEEIENDSNVDVILWDGGNNDVSFLESDLYITLADPERPNHEINYYPSLENFRLADVIYIGKRSLNNNVGTNIIKRNALHLNPTAKIIEAGYEVYTQNPEFINGKKVLVIEDGPTTTHGEMTFGMGRIAAEKYSARDLADPALSAVGEIKQILENYPHLKSSKILPAVGYNPQQLKELAATINNSDAETIILATPADLTEIISINKPVAKIDYKISQSAEEQITELIDKWHSRKRRIK